MSSPEDYPLSLCTPHDIPSLLPIYSAAFRPNPFSAAMYRTVTTSDKEAWLTQRFHLSFAKREIKHFKITEASSGRIVAFVRWGFPHVLSEQEESERREAKRMQEGMPQGPRGADEGLFEAKFGALDGFREKWVRGSECYLAHLLVTDPEHQRRGFGTRLLKHVLDMADAEGRPAYIEATEDGHQPYLRLGFKDVDQFTVDGEKWGVDAQATNYIMYREPVVKV